MKPITIPRLELTSCALSAEVGAMVKGELDMGSIVQKFWTDSKICLGYIHNDVKRYRIYVANRKQKVHNYSKKLQWNHVKKADNPADHASRGLSIVKDRAKVDQWFGGPEFLLQANEFWLNDSQDIYEVPDSDPEVKLCLSANVVNTNSKPASILSQLETRRSKWKDMVRIMTWVQRVVRREGWSKPLAVHDVTVAELTLLKMIQRELPG